MATGIRGRQTPRPQQQGNQGRQTPTPQGAQGNQGKQSNQGGDGRGRVVDPQTDGRVGNNTNPGNRNNEPQPERTDDLRETLGQQGQQSNEQQDPQVDQQDQMQDPRMFVASKLMDSAIETLALAGRIFKELDGEAGIVNEASDNVEYAQGCFDGLQGAIGKSMDALDQERNQA